MDPTHHKKPEDNVQLRAAVAGKITTKQGDIEDPYYPWLNMIYEDTISLIEEGIAQSRQGRLSYLFPIRDDLMRWKAENQLVKLLIPDHMQWIRGIDPHFTLKIYEEILKDPRNEHEIGMQMCDQYDEEGLPCTFVGRPDILGTHKWKHHGMCNPSKALVLTNECPACKGVVASLLCAKKHANEGHTKGQCPVSSKNPRRFLHELQVTPIDEYTCHICHEFLSGHDEVQDHLGAHLLKLFRPEGFPSPPEQHARAEA